LGPFVIKIYLFNWELRLKRSNKKVLKKENGYMVSQENLENYQHQEKVLDFSSPSLKINSQSFCVFISSSSSSFLLLTLLKKNEKEKFQKIGPSIFFK